MGDLCEFLGSPEVAAFSHAVHYMKHISRPTLPGLHPWILVNSTRIDHHYWTTVRCCKFKDDVLENIHQLLDNLEMWNIEANNIVRSVQCLPSKGYAEWVLLPCCLMVLNIVKWVQCLFFKGFAEWVLLPCCLMILNFNITTHKFLNIHTNIGGI